MQSILNIQTTTDSFWFSEKNESSWLNTKQYEEAREYKLRTNKNEIFNFFEGYVGGVTSFFTYQNKMYFYNNEKEISATISGYWPKDFYETSDKYRNIELLVKGRIEDVNQLVKAFELNFNEVIFNQKHVRWYDESNYGGVEGFDIALKKNSSFVSEFYPFIDDLYEWARNFFESDKNVLILIGEPGTGKSSLLREMLRVNDYDGYLTYNKSLMERDALYRKFFHDVKNSDSQKGVLILEDADLILLGREDTSNNAMAKLLNISDGIIDNPNMKFIFTANLDDVNKIDKALTRPGRCYDILEFRKLSVSEADRAAEKAGIIFGKPSGSFTVAEIYNNSKNKISNKQKMGFF